MSFSIRACLFIVAWCAFLMGAITLSLRLPYRSTDWPVGLLFIIVFCSTMLAAICAITDRSPNRSFWVGYTVVCLACWLASHSETLMNAHTLPHHAAVPLLRLRAESPTSAAQSNEMYYQMIRTLNLGTIPILAILGGGIARGRKIADSQD